MKNQWVVGSKSQDKQRILNPKWRKVLIGDRELQRLKAQRMKRDITVEDIDKNV